MVATLAVKMDNAVFGEDPGPELVRILRECADRIEREDRACYPGDSFAVRDVNGNTVGVMRFGDDPE